jgi:hypothetical protein
MSRFALAPARHAVRMVPPTDRPPVSPRAGQARAGVWARALNVVGGRALRGLPTPILLDVRWRIPLIAGVGAVVGVVIAALVWWPFDHAPSAPPRARTYGSALELASDLYRAQGECQHPREPTSYSYVYRCPVAGGRLYFFLLTQAVVEELKANVGEEFFQEIGGIPGYLRSFDRDLARSLDVPGMVVGPNWVAMSDWRVTLQAVQHAIGGELIIVDPTTSPSAGPLSVQYTVNLLPIGGEGLARVKYREPDGTMTTERVMLPWQSDIFLFRTGDLLVLEARTLDHLDHGEIAPLQCEVLIDPRNPEGNAAGSSRANTCDVRARARTSGGFSFPD